MDEALHPVLDKARIKAIQELDIYVLAEEAGAYDGAELPNAGALIARWTALAAIGAVPIPGFDDYRR